MGVEIINNTAETHELKFLGAGHRHYMHKSPLSVRSILGDTVYEDRDLRILTDYIYEARYTRIFATLLNTSLLYGAFKGKRFSIKVRRRFQDMQSASFNVSEYVKDNSTSAEIDSMFEIDFFSEFEQTNIEAGERLMILFNLGSREFHGMNDMIEKANKLYGEEKKKKILLIM